jgi:flagellum-specific ATP synthase/type III secretion protein N (ATPase)
VIELEGLTNIARDAAGPQFEGRVERVSGMLVEAAGVPAAIGELCRIDCGRSGPVDAEVVGFRDGATLLMPHGDTSGIAPRHRVRRLGRDFEIGVGDQLLSRTLDGLGRPIDEGPRLECTDRRRVRSDAPAPLARPLIDQALSTGVRALDACATLGRGQRIGVFAGSGVGKSTLISDILSGSDSDVTVLALVGERGREVRAFLDKALNGEQRKRVVCVVATSDRPPIERYLAPFVAVTIAEHFRDAGKDVLLVMDSITRFAQAAREIGLAAGEPAALRGYPPSFFATVPKIVERMGRTEQGSITGLLTVLVDGDDPNEPVSDTLRGLLDGHVHLSRDLANAGHFPAIDVLASLSRLMPDLVGPEHQALATQLRRDLAVWRDGRDLVEVGAYRAGTNPELDAALARRPLVEAFLRQEGPERLSMEETVALLAAVLGSQGEA